MLDTATKRRIDTARDILVGKVPDPKSQVEQITIALIYKFMDDIDAESEEMGGQRTFFAGDFAQYGWHIAEHLTPTGRAGIIVPEGIIFQSQTAHKQLRKMLVGESGMGDGVAESGVEYTADNVQPKFGLVAEKGKIAAGGEYNLSGERYRESLRISAAFPFFPIEQICTVNPRKSELSKFPADTEISFVPMADLNENQIAFVAKEHRILGEVGASYTYFADDDVLLAKVTPCFENGKAGIARNLKNGIGFGSSEFYVLRPTESVISQWIYLCIVTPAFRGWATSQMTGTGGLQRVPRSAVENYNIPLPPLATQQAIVAEIEAEQSLVAANRELAERMEGKVRAAIGRVWGDRQDENWKP